MKPFEVLGLAETATPDEVHLRWLTLRSEHHPDKGGDPAEFNRIHTAYQMAHAEALRPKPCEFCVNGKVETYRGFYKVSMPCVHCNGTGAVVNK